MQVANPSKMHIASDVANQMLVPYGELEDMRVATLDSFALPRVDCIKARARDERQQHPVQNSAVFY